METFNIEISEHIKIINQALAIDATLTIRIVCDEILVRRITEEVTLVKTTKSGHEKMPTKQAFKNNIEIDLSEVEISPDVYYQFYCS